MIKKSKRASDISENTEEPPKKLIKDFAGNSKKSKGNKNSKHEKPKVKQAQEDIKSENSDKKKNKPFQKKNTFQKPGATTEKTNWAELKQQKKELKAKRKQSNELYDVIAEAKKIAEVLRQKNLKGGKDERNKLVNQLHDMLGGKGHYAKLVLSHDMARVVQYLLKFGSENIRNAVSKELIPLSVDMLLSKYGRYCLKNMLKYGNGDTRSASINTLYGHAVKLTSHVVSAAVFEYTYSTWASPQQKHHLIQEFFGDMYKKSKDDSVKHLRDVYKDSPSMKAAALSAIKGNLARILTKNLLDSALVQSVLHQYITECSVEDRTELIGQLASHVVVLSNSKDGARVAMYCIWHGSNKDRKVVMKAIKEHVIDLSKHEHGHCTIIALLDAIDDTVLVNKMVISQILTNTESLAADEWGRKVILWLLAPADSTHFHPTFIKELEAGREAATVKKAPALRRQEILQHVGSSMLELIASNPVFWLSTASISVITLATLKTSSNDHLDEALNAIAETIIDPSWKVKENETDVLGIEHSGLHMTLKKLAQHDKLLSSSNITFGNSLLSVIHNEAFKLWLTLNRGCFLLVAVYENGTEEVQQQMRDKINVHLKLLKKQSSTGSRILLKKLT